VDAGEYGRILWMRGRYGKSVDRDFLSDWRSKRSRAGGGILMDQGIHMLDLLLMFAGDFDQVKSYCSNLYWNLDIEDNVFALLKNREGVVASLHSTMTQWRHLFALEVFLEAGYMVINGILSSSNSYTTADGKEVLTVAKNRSARPEARHSQEERFIYDEDNSWKREIVEFSDCVGNNKPVQIGTLDDALRLMRVMEMIYADGQS
jgi:predicted dehydrogenase